MKFISRITVLLYVTIILFLGSFTVLFCMNLIEFEPLADGLIMIYVDENLRVIFGSIGVGLLFINMIFYHVFSVNTHRDKVIAFDNPGGRVSVSLWALEDLVRKKVQSLPEVKDVKPRIKAGKKALEVKIRLMLKSEGNIPEISSKIQDVVKRKIQDTIGIEEKVNVTIYIGKIIPEKIKEKKKSQKQEKEPLEEERSVPFHGYRA